MPEKILVIRHGAFGDIVQADGALRDIRAHHADAEITLLTAPPYRKLMQHCPHVDALLLDERAPFWQWRKTLALWRALRAPCFSRVYDLQSSQRTATYQRFILPGIFWSRNQNRRSTITPDREAYVAQLTAAGVAASHAATPDVSWMAEDMSTFLAAANVKPAYVVLIPGCSAKHQHKRWPYYPELANALLAHGIEVVTVPGPDEIELAKGIPGKTLLHENGAFLNWFELAGVLKEAAFVIGNDTGPSHVASCLGRPGLVLFGSHTMARRTGILRDGFTAIEVDDLQALPARQVLQALECLMPPLGLGAIES
jgi:ADP-heptose:LPS heptosyltransferase